MDVVYLDIDRKDIRLDDFDVTHIPRQGDIIQLRHYVGNDNTLYYGEVLYVIDCKFLTGGKLGDLYTVTRSVQESYFVVMREITGEWGDKTYETIYNAVINPKVRNKKIEDILS